METIKSMPIDKIQFNPLNIYDETEEEAAEMELNVQLNGVKNDVELTSTGILTKGHRRVRAAIAVGITHLNVIIRDYESEEEMLKAMYLDNCYRTHKTMKIKYRELRLLERLFKTPQGFRSDLANTVKGTTRDKIGKLLGYSGKSIDMIKVIGEKRPDLFSKIDSGDMSISGGTKLIQFIEKKGLGDLGWEKLMNKVAELVLPHLTDLSVPVNGVELSLLFNQAVRRLSVTDKRKAEEKPESDTPSVDSAVQEERTSLDKEDVAEEESAKQVVLKNEVKAKPVPDTNNTKKPKGETCPTCPTCGQQWPGGGMPPSLEASVTEQGQTETLFNMGNK